MQFARHALLRSSRDNTDSNTVCSHVERHVKWCRNARSMMSPLQYINYYYKCVWISKCFVLRVCLLCEDTEFQNRRRHRCTHTHAHTHTRIHSSTYSV